FGFFMSSGLLQASPWAAVGDLQLRDDVEILARYGVITGPVNSWPISWKQITRNLSRTPEMNLPSYVRAAVLRVRGKIPGKFNVGLAVRATNNPAIVRSFQKTARNDLDVTARAEYNNSASGTTVHIQGGYRKGNGEKYSHLDGSYLSQDIGNWAVYAGAFQRWWGPGRETTLLLSNNARPMPSVGLRRIEPEAFQNRWFSWMGPWQWDMFVARMSKNRAHPHALIIGMRLTFEPIRNFEVGLSRILQFCGQNRPCSLSTWVKSLGAIGENKPGGSGNQLASIDLGYTMAVGKRTSLKLYAEGTAEDQNVIMPFQYARLVGATFYGPWGDKGGQWRLTTEISDTRDSLAWFFGRIRYNVIYEHSTYTTGYRFRGRSLGGSLDNDSILISVAGEYQAPDGWLYRLKYHRAEINIDGAGKNTVSVPRKNLNIIEASVTGSLGFGKIKLDLRHASDGIPRLGNTGAFTTIGIDWSVGY
ncbi:MAG: capsule assembly Wzi family protein, partial [Alphaproteobacteria bacterium]|nr:capsule assembly Wzi family protein [Alphaproteobacteria bacterium]